MPALTPMKASEVLRRYAAGERDFRRTNLRGQSFKGQDLSGADFSEADIRGANFSNASLKGANFTWSQAGIQKRWILAQLVFLVTLARLAGFLQNHFSAYFAPYLKEEYILKTYGFPLATTAIVTFLIFVAFYSWASPDFASEGVIKTDWVSITIFVIGCAAISALGSTMFVGLILGTANAVAAAGTEAGSIIVAASAAVTGVIIGVVTIAAAVAVAGIVAGGVISLIILGVADSASQSTGTGNFISFAGALLIVYISWITFEKEDRLPSIRRAGINFAASAGTKFCGSNLINANFTGATLKSTNFNYSEQQTLLEHVCWKDAQKLDRARLGNSILTNPSVRELLVTRNGYKKSYIDANLRTANLNGVNLEQANMTWTDLTCADLRHANLKNANLLESLVLDTDFTGATLTGACLEAWNIDHNTKLKNVDCQYVYLLRNQQERRPSGCPIIR